MPHELRDRPNQRKSLDPERKCPMTQTFEDAGKFGKEFVDMIKVQRGFQASAKSITTANDMLEEVLNLRRA